MSVDEGRRGRGGCVWWRLKGLGQSELFLLGGDCRVLAFLVFLVGHGCDAEDCESVDVESVEKRMKRGCEDEPHVIYTP